MKILVVTSSYPRFEGDISGKFVREHCDLLKSAGHEVRVLAWADPRAQDTSVEWVEYTDGPGIFFGAGAPENLESTPMLARLVPRAFGAMFERVIEHAAWSDLLIGHWLVPSGLIVRLAAWIESKPSLVICHSGGVHLVARMPRSLHRHVARIMEGPMTASSQALSRKLASVGLDAQVLPMGVPSGSLLDAESDDWLVMSRLTPIKGVELAIRAFAAARIATTLHIAGDGPERASLERLASTLGARVHFHGWATGNQKEALLAKCRYLLLPSKIENQRFEGFPTGLIEAQLAGLIPLVSDSPGLPEAVFDPRLVVMGRDPQEWARRIRRLPLERLDATDAHRFASGYTWSSLEADWLEQISQASRRCRSASF